ncbi:MAG: glycosyltransferase family 2 protein [Pseudomonadota bacterium]
MPKDTPPAPDTLKVAALAIAKNEGPWLLEWAAHCKAVGFDTIVLGTNDCDDGTDALANRMQEMGILTHFDNAPPYYRFNSFNVPSLQLTAYHRMQSMKEIVDCDWVMPLDLDEFLVVHVGEGSVKELCAKHHLVHSIMMRWRMFGDNGCGGVIDAPITDKLTRCAMKGDHRNENVKMLIREHQDVDIDMHISVRRPLPLKASFWQRVVRRARGMQAKAIISLDGKYYWLKRAYGNKKYLEHFKDIGRDYVDAQVNHYAIRTKDLLRLKSCRGDAYYTHTNRFQEDYYDTFNRNEEEDFSIQRYKPGRDAILTKWLSDDQLRALYEASVQTTRLKMEKMDAAGITLEPVSKKNKRLGLFQKARLRRENRKV